MADKGFVRGVVEAIVKSVDRSKEAREAREAQKAKDARKAEEAREAREARVGKKYADAELPVTIVKPRK